MDEEIDIADESLPTFTIPSTNKKAAIKFILDTIHDTLNAAIWSHVQFDSHDPDKLDLYQLWTDIEPLLEGDSLLSEIKLSSATPDCLIIKCEGERHRNVKLDFFRDFDRAVQDRNERTTQKNRTIPEFPITGTDIRGRDAKHVADLALLDDNGNPTVWCEIADSQPFQKVQQKIMRVGSVCPTIVTFVIIHIFPEGGGRLPNYNPDFLVDFQVSRRLILMDQLGDGEFCTLGVRRLEETFDSYIVDRRVFEFMEPVDSPIMRRVGDDTVLQLATDERVGAENRMDADDDNFIIRFDLHTTLRNLQMDRDQNALIALNRVQQDADNRTDEPPARQVERDGFRARLVRVPRHLNTAYAARIVGGNGIFDPVRMYLAYYNHVPLLVAIPQAVTEAMLLR